MSFQNGFTIYTFASIDFARAPDSDEVVPWFYPESQYTKDPVLGGGAVYLDIGASVAPPLSFRASCLNSDDRGDLIAALGTAGTLSNTRGHAGTVLLLKATPINSGNYRNWYIDLTFELLPV